MASISVNAGQLAVLHHSLGLRPSQRNAYRNSFVAGPGHHDMPHLSALVSAGLMVRVKAPAFLTDGDAVFSCTDAGKAYAIANLADLPPPAKLSRYREYLRCDCGHTFWEWLGINKPRVDSRRSVGGQWEYRMFRLEKPYRWISNESVSGEWAPTIKAAKASYKAALKNVLRGGV